jgi:hypothetical protein
MPQVRFPFHATALGTAVIQFYATDNQGNQDAIQLTVPINPQQSLVNVATSFALRVPPAANGSSNTGNTGGGTGQWQEGIALPAAVPGSGSLDLTSGR